MGKKIIWTHRADVEVNQAFLDLLGESGSYEKHSYRISYLVENEAVHIIRVRHARKEPLEYQLPYTPRTLCGKGLKKLPN